MCYLRYALFEQMDQYNKSLREREEVKAFPYIFFFFLCFSYIFLQRKKKYVNNSKKENKQKNINKTKKELMRLEL